MLIASSQRCQLPQGQKASISAVTQFFQVSFEGILRAIVVLAAATAVLGALFGVQLDLLAKAAGSAASLCLIAIFGGLGGSLSNATSEEDWKRSAQTIFWLLSAASLIWAIVYASPQTNDFGVYWRCGTNPIFPLRDWMDNCNSSYLTAPGLYGRRSFFYTLPIGLVFGSSYLALKLVNAFLHILTAALLSKIVHDRLGARAATLALLLLALQAEWWFTITSAMTDNLAVPLIVAGLFLISKLHGQGRLGYAVLLAALIVAVEWSRTIGTIMSLTLFGVLLLEKRRRFRSRLLLTALTIVLAQTAISGLNWFFPIPSSAVGPLTGMFAFDVNIRPPQNAQVIFEWMDHLWRAIDPDQRSYISFIRFVDELAANFLQWPVYMADKARLFFEGTGNLYFLGDHWKGNLDYVYTAPRNTAPEGPFAMQASGAAVVPCLMIAVAALLRAKLTSLGLAALTFFAVLTVVIIAFGPILSRYATLVVPSVAIIGAHFAKKDDGLSEARLETMRVLRRVAAGVVALAAIFGVGFIGAALWQQLHPRLLRTLIQDQPLRVGETVCNERPLPLWPYFSYRLVMGSMEPAVQCVSLSTPIPSGASEVSFFVSREKLSYPSERLDQPEFEYAFRVGDGNVQWRRLTGDAAWHSIKFDRDEGGDARTLQLIFRRVTPEKEIRFIVRDMLVLK